MEQAITDRARKKAIDFLENETQFQLGMLPTEQSHPKTKNLDTIFAESAEAGVELLLTVDEDIIPMAEKVFASKEFALMLKCSYETVINGGKIIISGCGSTGRLSILLESGWRTFFRQLEYNQPEIFRKIAKFENRLFSIMTGGDYALVKSVESFEDYPQFGQCQAQELKLNSPDILIAITEGGETSSVLGTVAEAIRVGAKPFLLFNNPTEILTEHIERSRKIISNSAVTVLELYCGPMAIAGSTRMQATSSEQLIVGAMLEQLLGKLMQESLFPQEFARFPDSDIDYAAAMSAVINDLKSSNALKTIAEYIAFEENVYSQQGLVTYFADEFLIDVFTDTTERAPTFMTPSFRKFDDLENLPSWAFAKTAFYPTEKAWRHYLGRELRCLNWQRDDYIKLNAPQHIIDSPPAISAKEMLKFYIGNEAECYRYESANSAGVIILSSSEFDKNKLNKLLPAIKAFPKSKILIVDTVAKPPEGALIIPGTVRKTNLNLMGRLKIKLALNIISTGTMVKLGRIKGNWMSFVSMSNKKLIDRSIRLIADFATISYNDACLELYQSLEELEKMDFTGKEVPSLVQYTLNKLTKPATPERRTANFQHRTSNKQEKYKFLLD